MWVALLPFGSKTKWTLRISCYLYLIQQLLLRVFLLLQIMAATKRVKIDIVGTGLIGPRHAEAVLKDPDAELTFIVDPNPTASAVAKSLKFPLYPFIKAMLASPSKPDAAIVCPPNHTHVAVTKELLDGGLHVLCEKPISVNLNSGQELVC